MHVMFYLVLSWLSTRKQKLFGIPCFLILCLVTWMIHYCFFCNGCSWVSCLFWTVKLSSVLQKKSYMTCIFFSFSIFCIFEPFTAVTVWFWDPSFHTEDNRGTQTQILKKVQTFTWCSWRNHDGIRAGGENFEQDEDFFSYCCWNIYIVYIFFFFFHLVLPFRSNRRYLDVSPEDN